MTGNIIEQIGTSGLLIISLIIIILILLLSLKVKGNQNKREVKKLRAECSSITDIALSNVEKCEKQIKSLLYFVDANNSSALFNQLRGRIEEVIENTQTDNDDKLAIIQILVQKQTEKNNSSQSQLDEKKPETE